MKVYNVSHYTAGPRITETELWLWSQSVSWKLCLLSSSFLHNHSSVDIVQPYSVHFLISVPSSTSFPWLIHFFLCLGLTHCFGSPGMVPLALVLPHDISIWTFSNMFWISYLLIQIHSNSTARGILIQIIFCIRPWKLGKWCISRFVTVEHIFIVLFTESGSVGGIGVGVSKLFIIIISSPISKKGCTFQT